LKEIVIILSLSVLLILIFQRLKLPSILGLLLAGMVAGPYGLSLVKASHEVEMLSEIGVIFLLFVIGIEFSLKGLMAIKKTVLLGGFVQVFGTIAAVFGIASALGLSWNEALFLGFLLSLSSTAIVLKLLQSKGELTTPNGRIAIGILIFQDVIVVPMMLVAPMLSDQSGNVSMELIMMAVKVIAVIAIVVLMARYVVPKILEMVVKTRSQELFILTIIVLCFATAWLTSVAGLSLALGAFFAGLVISESDYSHQATANILPFREIFISFFFVSIGMLLNIGFFLENIHWIVLLTLAVILVKSIIVGLAAFVLRYDAKTILISAFTLFQVGEFAFLLSTTGLKYNLITDDLYQYFLATSILSMAITPFVYNKSSELAAWFLRAPLTSKIGQKLGNSDKIKASQEFEPETLKDHLIIIGYGLNGKNLSRAANSANIPYVIIELNPETTQEMKIKGEPIVYGDARQHAILHHVHAHEARVAVVAISDPEATKAVVGQLRLLSKSIYIIVRTRYIKEMEELTRLGANEVIPEEFETSIEIFSRVLKKYLVTEHKVRAFVDHIRSQNYDLLINQDQSKATPESLFFDIPKIDIASLRVEQENNKIVGKSFIESNLRRNFGITVLAIKRGNDYIPQPEPDEKVKQDDVLFVFGKTEDIHKFDEYLKI
ncbi:MAG: cation:proton antiporter, partial [Chitinophagales bacterium]